jgi:hypothetical protein
MSNASIRTEPAPVLNTAGSTSITNGPPVVAIGRMTGVARRSIQALASLRLTVALFVFALVLVFLGTLAQVFQSNVAVTQQFFRSWYVHVPFQLLVHFARVFFQGWLPADYQLNGSFLYPGGRTIGFLLLANLLAAHTMRFKLSWKRAGVVLLHAGLVVLMLGELVTSMMAVEGRMMIWQQGSSNYTENYSAAELAVVDPSDAKVDDVVAVSGAALRRGDVISNANLPFDLKVDRYLKNSALMEVTSADQGSANVATAGSGLSRGIKELPEGSGVDSDQAVDKAACYVTFLEKGTGKKLNTYLFSVDLMPQPVVVGGKTYEVSLRPERSYKPYAIELLKFDHKLYAGTSTPKDFRSTVRLTDPARGEDRKVDIYMNHPLVYQGETFYQSSWIPGDRGTILQVVRNPGWPLPYLSCALVTLGMAIHFGIHLNGFLQRRAAL